MKMKSTFIADILLLVSVMTEGGLSAQNPIVQTCYTSDPAPMVHDGTLYVYTGHDEDKADFFWMHCAAQERSSAQSNDSMARGEPIGPVHHIFGRIHAPFLHPEKISLIFIMSRIDIQCATFI